MYKRDGIVTKNEYYEYPQGAVFLGDIVLLVSISSFGFQVLTEEDVCYHIWQALKK